MIRLYERAEPATPPADRAWLYVDETTGRFTAKKDDGSVVDLETSGGVGEIFPANVQGSPTNIAAGTTIPVSATINREMRFITATGHVTSTAVPAVAAPYRIGQELYLVFEGGVGDTLRLNTGNGIRLNGNITFRPGATLYLVAITMSLWQEFGRNDV